VSISTEDMEVTFHDGTAWQTIHVVCLTPRGEPLKKFWEREVTRLRSVYSLPYGTLIVRERRGW
jgi:hypothetical protein